VSALNDAMARFKIEGRLRVAAFLAQVGHESGQLDCRTPERYGPIFRGVMG
jgi:predicted chitinase